MRTITVTQSMIYWERPTAFAWWPKTKRHRTEDWGPSLYNKSSPKRWLIVGFTEGRNQGKYWTKQYFHKLKTEHIAKAQPRLLHHGLRIHALFLWKLWSCRRCLAPSFPQFSIWVRSWSSFAVSGWQRPFRHLDASFALLEFQASKSLMASKG